MTDAMSETADKPTIDHELWTLLRRCRDFVIAACEANVQVKGFDPTRHVLVREIDTYVEKRRKSHA